MAFRLAAGGLQPVIPDWQEAAVVILDLVADDSSIDLTQIANVPPPLFAAMAGHLNRRLRSLEVESAQHRGATLASGRTGFRPGDPCPDLLNEEEAIRYLRLDEIDIKNPDETLRRYRKAGQLNGTQLSKRVYYRRSELDAFMDRMTTDNPR